MSSARPHELVEEPDYFRDVLGNMRMVTDKELRRVRFGLTGEGFAPNYEITVPDGNYMETTVRFPISGLTHKTHHQAPEPFEAANLTEKFSWEDVLEMLARALNRKKHKQAAKTPPKNASS